jgi:hypothetical protein
LLSGQTRIPSGQDERPVLHKAPAFSTGLMALLKAKSPKKFTANSSRLCRVAAWGTLHSLCSRDVSAILEASWYVIAGFSALPRRQLDETLTDWRAEPQPDPSSTQIST